MNKSTPRNKGFQSTVLYSLAVTDKAPEDAQLVPGMASIW